MKMTLNIGSKIRIWVSNNSPVDGYIFNIEEHDGIKVHHGFLIGKNKNGTFEIVERDGMVGGSVYWPPEQKRTYNASFIDDFKEIEEGE